MSSIAIQLQNTTNRQKYPGISSYLDRNIATSLFTFFQVYIHIASWVQWNIIVPKQRCGVNIQAPPHLLDKINTVSTMILNRPGKNGGNLASWVAPGTQSWVPACLKNYWDQGPTVVSYVNSNIVRKILRNPIALSMSHEFRLQWFKGHLHTWQFKGHCHEFIVVQSAVS